MTFRFHFFILLFQRVTFSRPKISYKISGRTRDLLSYFLLTNWPIFGPGERRLTRRRPSSSVSAVQFSFHRKCSIFRFHSVAKITASVSSTASFGGVSNPYKYSIEQYCWLIIFTLKYDCFWKERWKPIIYWQIKVKYASRLIYTHRQHHRFREQHLWSFLC